MAMERQRPEITTRGKNYFRNWLWFAGPTYRVFRDYVDSDANAVDITPYIKELERWHSFLRAENPEGLSGDIEANIADGKLTLGLIKPMAYDAINLPPHLGDTSATMYYIQEIRNRLGLNGLVSAVSMIMFPTQVDR